MRVKLRVRRASGPMLKAGAYQIAGGLARHAAAMPNTGCRHMRLDMRERRLNRLPMRFDQPPVACNLGHDRHRLRCAEGHIPAGTMFELAVANRAEPLACHFPVEPFAASIAIDVTPQPKLLPHRNRKKAVYGKN